jgi:HAMP domain-containing protein
VVPLLDAYVASAQEIVGVSLTSSAAGRAKLPDFMIAFSDLEASMETLGEQIESRGSSVGLAAQQATGGVKYVLMIGAAIAAVALAITTQVISRSISGPLIEVKQGLTQLADGNLATRIGGTGRQDEIGEIAAALEVLRDRLQQAREQETEMLQGAQQRVVRALSIGLRNLSTGNLTQPIEEPFAEDYETAEKMAIGGGYTIPENRLGTVTLGASAYFSDNTILSDSILRHRPRLRNSDGGVTNTQDPSSYIVTADVADAGGITGLAVHTGHRSQKRGDADPVENDNEHGNVFGANYNYAINDNVEADILGEVAQINNVDGGSDGARHTTAAISFLINEHWNAGLSYGGRDTLVQDDADIHDSFSQITGGYAFDNGITFDLSYAHFKESGISTDTVGALAAYTYEF